jgi:hypothetical protein
MPQLRRVLAPVAALWLLCQAGSVVLVPLALWITVADPHGAECTCGHGLDAMCPMHHKPVSSQKRCAMQAADGSGTAVLTSLAGVAGLIPERVPDLVPALATPRVAAPDPHLHGERPVPPDPPPPRA